MLENEVFGGKFLENDVLDNKNLENDVFQKKKNSKMVFSRTVFFSPMTFPRNIGKFTLLCLC